MTDRSTSQLEMSVLGPLRVAAGEVQIEPGGPKPRLVLALLIMHAGDVVSIDGLIDDLWDDDPPPTARKTLQVHVSNLRRNLGQDAPIVTERQGYRLDPTRVAIDVVEFERDCERARALPPDEASSVLASALARWRGLAYADLRHENAIRAEAVRLDELRVSAIEQRIDADLRLGRHERLVGELEALTTEHPFRERLRCLHLLALYRSGRQAEALRAYERARRTLAEDVGLDPGHELRHLHQAILEQSPELDLAEIAEPSRATWSVRGYEIRELIARRTGGSVHRAYQPSVGREVAMRVIPPELANEPEFVRRFEADCRLLGGLDHPHIVSLYDYWRDPGGAYLVMPLLRGGTLEHTLSSGPLELPAALRVIEQVGAALDHAHQHGVVHGDLRPSNILLDDDGNAYLSDFAPDGHPRSSEALSGCTLDYASPEQRGGAAIDRATDVWSFGVLACHLLTGAGIEEGPFTRTGLPGGLLSDLRRATDPDPVRRFESVEDVVRACHRAFGAGPLTGPLPAPERRARNPYKGLRAFGESDAADFFGRGDLVDELVVRVSEAPLTVVVGPSGCGKSSAIRAGLIPILRRHGLSTGRPVVVAEMFPGAYPFEELESALLRIAVDRPAGLLDELRSDDGGLLRVAERILPDESTDLVLVVDQFEELFTLTRDDADRQRFLACLRAVGVDPRCRLHVVATLRADYFDRPLRHAAFGDVVRASTVTVAMPSEASLAEAITEPARRVGLQLEPGLLTTILGDVADQPGALPMLQYALTELVADRRDDVLTVEAYRRTGGVVGALARRADTIYEELPPDAHEAAREMFVRLVSVNDESDDTRRRVRLTELRGLDVDPAGLDVAIDAFGTFRLLTFDRDAATRGPTVEIAHEALIREWPRLREWIDERRDDLLTERRVRAEAAEWGAAGRDPSYLIGGARLRRYEEWAASADVRLSVDERSFVETSRALQDHREQLTVRRRRSIMSILALLAVAAIVAAGVAVIQRERADEQAREAASQSAAANDLRTAAERRSLEDEARAMMAQVADHPDADLRLLLALGTHDVLAAAGADVSAVAGALYQFMVDHGAQTRLSLAGLAAEDLFHRQRIPTAVGLHASTDGSVLVATPVGGSTVTTFESRTGERIGSIEVDADATGSAWDPTRNLVLTGTNDGRIHAWHPGGEMVETFPTGGQIVWPISWSPDAAVYADFGVSGPATRLLGESRVLSVVVVDPASGDELYRTGRTVRKFAAAPDASRLLTIDIDQQVHVIDLSEFVDDSRAHWPAAVSADWGADNRTIWVLDGRRLVAIDSVTGEIGVEVATGLTNATYVDVSPGGVLAVVGRPGAPARILTLPDGDVVADLLSSVGSQTEQEIAARASEPRGTPSVSWLTDRRLVVEHGDPVIWDLADLPAPTTLWPGISFEPVMSAVLPSGELLIGSELGEVVVVEPGGAVRERFEGGAADRDAPAPAVLSADGRTLAVPGASAVEVADVLTGDELARGPEGYPRPIALTPDGRRMLVAGSRDPADGSHRFALVDVLTEDVVQVVGSFAAAERATVSADGEVALVAASVRRFGSALPTQPWLVDMETGAVIREGPPQDCIVDLAIDGFDERAVAVGCDGTVVLYDLALLGTNQTSTSDIDVVEDIGATGTGIAFSPDGGTVFVSRADGRVDAFKVDHDALVPAWSFDVGDHAGGLFVEGGILWIGVTRPIALRGDVGGLIGVPLDLDELVAFARTLPTRALSDAECAEYAGLACPAS